MYLISTAELRWFYPGHIPDQVFRWLKGLNGHYEDQPLRTDNYLLLPDHDNLGIKLRQGRIEIKKRTEVHPDYLRSGRVESWIKWSIPVEQNTPSPFHFFHDKAQWIAIDKKRFVQKFAIDNNQSIISYPTTTYPQEGVMVECAELKINSQPNWTIALECFGSAEKVYPNLLSILPGMLNNYFDFPLSFSHSQSYPEWINLMIK